MWLAELLRLLWRSVVATPSLVSGNWFGVLFEVFVFLVVEGITLKVRGWDKMKERWKESLAIGVSAVIVSWIALILVSIVVMIYRDHRDDVGRWKAVVNEKNSLKSMLGQRDIYINDLKSRRPPSSPKGAPMVRASISSRTKELPLESFASHGLPTTESYVTAHGTIFDPTFVLECDSPCAYENAMSLSTGTLPESKQLSSTRIRVNFLIPSQLSDGQQVSIRVRSENHEPIHAIKVRRVMK